MNAAITPKNTELVEFTDTHGGKVELSPDIVKRFITGDNGTVTEGEYKLFVELCKARQLNPFLKEAYCIKYGTQPAQILVSKDVYVQRADSFADYDGKASGVIIADKRTGSTIEREGCFYNPKSEELLGAWCRVFRKGRNHPDYMSVALTEVEQRKKTGELNSNWAKQPATMCEKVAVVRALRAAFPSQFSQMYIADEMPDISPAAVAEASTNAQDGDSGKVINPAYTDLTPATESEDSAQQYVCCDCGKPFEPWERANGEHWTAQQVYELAASKNADGKARCTPCGNAYRENLIKQMAAKESATYAAYAKD